MADSDNDSQGRGPVNRPSGDASDHLSSDELRQAEQTSAEFQHAAQGSGGGLRVAPRSSVYDDQQPQFGKPLEQISRPSDVLARAKAGKGNELTPAELSSAEQTAEGIRFVRQKHDEIMARSKEIQDRLDADEDSRSRGFYNRDHEDAEKNQKGFKKAVRGLGRFARKHKKFTISGFAGVAAATALIGAFSSLLPFELHHILQNMDSTTFARLQGVDMNGRSQSYIKAYMKARLLDITDRDSQKMTDNLLFQADRVQTSNNPFVNWYRTIRLYGYTNDKLGVNIVGFDQKMFENQGIKFTSMYERVPITDKNGNVLSYKTQARTAKIIIKDTELDFDPFNGPDAIPTDLFDRMQKGDVKALEQFNRLTGKLDQFISVEVYDHHADARKAIKDAVKGESTHWWQMFTRRQWRKDLMNVTGTRSWTFFEKTQQAWRDKKIDIRNVIISKSFPGDGKMSQFIRCMFGIDSCKASTDPADPENQSLPADGTKTDESKKGDANGDGKSGENYGDGQAPGTIDETIGSPPTGEVLSDTAKNIASKLLGKLNLATSIFGFLDAFANVDKSLHDGKLNKLIYNARGAQTAGIYASLKNANDQTQTNEFSGDQLNALMGTVSNATNNESWSTVVNHQPTVVHADTLLPANSEQEQCSNDYQEKMKTHPVDAERQFQFLCESQKIGGSSTAKDISDAWDSTVGIVLHPILQLYQHTIGVVSSLFQDLIGFITQPLMDGIMNGLGLKGAIQDLVGWITNKAAEFLGAAPMYDGTNPNGQLINFAFEGASYSAEASTRDNGGALTTPQTKLAATKRYLAYKEENAQDMSLNEKYLSLNNPDSIASKMAFALVNTPPSTITSNILSSVGSIITSPLSAFSNRANAATDDPYAMANLGGIETYDFPTQCLDADPITMQPTDATNAVTLGILQPSDVTWDLLDDKAAFWAKIYEKVGDNEDLAQKVWDCGALDNATRSGMGGAFGYKGVGDLSD